MRKLLYFLCLIFITSATIVSCDMAFDEPFNQDLLVGKWKSGTEFYKYASDGTGTTWDEADDVYEDEAQAFTWTLVQDELTHIHLMELGGSVPKVYTLTELTSTTLKYEDGFGKQFSYTKVASE
ncbi:MAG TPA: hypothetical protein PLS94_10085 [Prolixibacteraceae bacterium]|nr:hypothetical protein [Prolixibacteraceae bacterium]HPR62018.1 hypothetical protein [Prolixibacteraceae bacterium]